MSLKLTVIMLQFKVPCNIGVFAPTMAGKSTLVYDILKKRKQLFDRAVGKIYYIFGVWTDMYNEMQQYFGKDIVFLPDIPSQEDMKEWCTKEKSKSICIVFDDHMTSHLPATLATMYAHHYNCVFINISQNVFHQTKEHRTISLNLQYMLLGRMKRDKSQVVVLARQLYPHNPKVFLEAYEDAVSEPFQYLRVDVHPHTDGRLMLSSHFLEPYPIIYLPKTSHPEPISL